MDSTLSHSAEHADPAMQDTPKKPGQQSPADIAREAFRRLAARRVAPTPDAYQEIYNEIAGIQDEKPAEQLLAEFAASLTKAPAEIAAIARDLNRAAQSREWQDYARHLRQLADQHLLSSRPRNTDAIETAHAPIAVIDHESQLPAPRPAYDLVDPVATTQKHDSPEATELLNHPTFSPGRQARVLREMLVRTLTLAVPSLLHAAPELAQEADAFAREIDNARAEHTLADIEPRLKQFCFKIELKGADLAEEQELLLRLFRLLLENIGELVEDDSWLSGQVASVHDLLSGPINYASLMDATRSLKEVIYKQSLLKHSLSEAKGTLKNMMITFIDRLSAVTVSTSEYQEKISKYSLQIGEAKNINQLNALLDQVMQDTRTVHVEARRSLDDMVAARREVQEAENRIHTLETELKQLSELVREDQLTGSLNRRGLDDVLEREFARSERRGHPLCIAMLDLDDFKRLNDTHGHTAGDQALIHLVRVVKETLRAMDIIGRFGGEEFMIVLPDTSLDAAAKTITRVQRELTKRIFMHNHERLLITFSSGVALRKPGEDQLTLIRRADDALYKAKKAGKNRVVPAD